MNFAASLGTPVSTARSASIPVEKPEPPPIVKRKRGGYRGPYKALADRVTVRGVSLLPRDWAWLKAQPGGVSAALRCLVETARTAERSG